MSDDLYGKITLMKFKEIGLILLLGLFLMVAVLATKVSGKTQEAVLIYPDSGFSYMVKRFKEKAGLFFQITPVRKTGYLQKLLEVRLAELQYTVEKKDVAHIEKVSQRYETTAGLLAEYLVAKKMVSKKAEVTRIFQKHSQEINQLIDVFPFDTAERRLVINDVNSLNIYMEMLSAL